MRNRMPPMKRLPNWRNMRMSFCSSPRTWTTCTSALDCQEKKWFRFTETFFSRVAHVVIGGRSSATPIQATIAIKVGSRELAPPSLNSASKRRGKKMAARDVLNEVQPCDLDEFRSESLYLGVKRN